MSSESSPQPLSPDRVFTPTRSPKPEVWVDRAEEDAAGGANVQDLLAQYLSEVGRQLIVTGVAGVGKTSLVEHICSAADLSVVRVQCGPPLEIVLQEALAKAGVLEEQFEEVEQISGRAGIRANLFVLFSGLQREDTDTTRRAAYKASLATTAREALNAASISVLFLDNFESSFRADQSDSSFAPAFAADVNQLLKSFASEGHTKAVVAGIPVEARALLPLDPGSARLATEISVPRMADSELRQVIALGSGYLGLQFDQDCVEEIVRISRGLPYKTHELALRAARLARRGNVTRVTLGHLQGSSPDTQRSPAPLGDNERAATASPGVSRLVAREAATGDSSAVSAPPSPTAWIIRDVMNPRFLLEQLHTVWRRIEASGRSTALPPSIYNEKVLFLEDQAASRKDLPFMPREPFTSILQSVLTFALAARADEVLAPTPRELRNVAHAMVTSSSVLTDFGPASPAYIDQKLAECLRMLDDPHRVSAPPRPAPPVEMGRETRLILVGDWATALPSALAVAGHIRTQIDTARASGVDVHVIHLGDTYYSGWVEEYEGRFLPYWPVSPREDGIGSWALAGNHDMYSAGHGYFGRLLLDQRFARQGGSSWFTLRNRDWTVVGLDSSYLDQSLTQAQVDLLSTVVGSERRTILLTHHTPLLAGASELLRRVGTAVGYGGLDAWFWGHEHRCEVYSPHALDADLFASCVGHGGVPELLVPGPSPIDDLVRWTPTSQEAVGAYMRPLRGFAVVDLIGPTGGVSYVNERGDCEGKFGI